MGARLLEDLASLVRSPELKDEVSKEVKKDPSNLTQVEAVCLYIRVGRYAAAIALLMGAPPEEAKADTTGHLECLCHLVTAYLRQLQQRAETKWLSSPENAELAGRCRAAFQKQRPVAEMAKQAKPDPSEKDAHEAVKMCSELRSVLQKVFGEKRCDDWMKNSGRPKLRAFMKDCLKRNEFRATALLAMHAVQWAVTHPEIREEHDDSLVVDDLSSLGTACSKLELYDIAEKAFQEAVRAFHARSWDTENKPAIGLVLYNYSDLLLQLGRFDEAEATCRKAMEHHDAGEEYAKSCLKEILACKCCEYSSGRVKTMIRLRTKLAAKHSAAKSLAPMAAETPLLPPSYYVDSQLTGEEVQKGRSKKNKRKEKREEANPVTEEPTTEAATESPPEEKPPPETAEAPEVPEESSEAIPTIAQREDGLCLACQAKDADIVSSACGHLTFCKACRRRAVHQALEAKECAKSVKKRKDLSSRELERTVVPCPICRAEGVLVPLAKFAGKVFGLPEKISGEPKSEASQVTPEQESTEDPKS